MIRKLKPEIKQLWLAALRSGDYKQTTGFLREADNSMCCLGVLCNLHAQAHPKIAVRQDDPTTYMGNIFIPPDEVLKWAFWGWKRGDDATVEFRQISDDHRDCHTYGGIAHLATLNDTGRHSFKQIANVIDKYL